MTHVLLVALNARYTQTNLAVRYLAAQAKAHARTDLTLSVGEWSINDRLFFLLNELVVSGADCVAFSRYIWNSQLTRTLIRELKKIRPSVRILVGGPEAASQADPWLAAYPEIDFILSGEGEKAFVQLLDLLAQNPDPDPKSLMAIPGLSWRRGSQLIHNPLEQVLQQADWPFPYTETDLQSHQEHLLYYETSRGCPYACAYCFSARDRHVRALSATEAVRRLTALADGNAKLVKLVDRTFNCRPQRARAIWQHLIDRHRQAPYRTQFHFELAGDLLDQESLDLLEQAPAGLFRFEIGVQSIHPAVLAAVNRTCDVDRLVRQTRRLRQTSPVVLHLDLIAGLPGESMALFARSFDAVYMLQPDLFQVGFLKVLPGTPMYEKARSLGYRWLSQPPYEVLQSDSLSFSELNRLRAIENMLDLYYHNHTCRPATQILAAFWDSPFAFYLALSHWFDRQRLFDRSLGVEERCRVLQIFATEQLRAKGRQEARFVADLIRTCFQAGGERGQPAGMTFLSHRKGASDQALHALLSQLRQAAARQAGPAKLRFDRISFDWPHFVKTGKMLAADYLLAYSAAGGGMVLWGHGPREQGLPKEDPGP